MYERIPVPERRLEKIRLHQEENKMFKVTNDICQSGWPPKEVIPCILKPYLPVASELSVEKGLLMRGSRVVIPASLRVDMLDKLHAGHQGITKCRERAKCSVWWPELSKQLEETVKSCPERIKQSPQKSEPLKPTNLPDLKSSLGKKLAQTCLSGTRHRTYS